MKPKKSSRIGDIVSKLDAVSTDFDKEHEVEIKGKKFSKKTKPLDEFELREREI